MKHVTVRRAAFGLLITALAGTFASIAPPVGAVDVGGASPFGIQPTPVNGSVRSYFIYSLAAGGTHADQVVVTNISRNEEVLKLGVGDGSTAPNSGSTYLGGAFSPCVGTACWVTGLPSEVTLAPGAQKTVPFTVAVPANTPSGQYLAGITGQPVKSAAPVNVGGNGSASAQAIIVDQVTVAIAVTVGSVASLTSDLVIIGVAGSVVGSTERLAVLVKNEGQTFVHGTGKATCTTGTTSLDFPVTMNTVLPGDEATVVVNASGLPPSELAHCIIGLPYGAPTKATWKGSVAVPAIAKTKEVHTGPGVYSQLPPSKVPTVIVALLAAAGGVIVILLITLIVVVRRRRRIAAAAHASAPPEA